MSDPHDPAAPRPEADPKPTGAAPPGSPAPSAEDAVDVDLGDDAAFELVEEVDGPPPDDLAVSMVFDEAPRFGPASDGHIAFDLPSGPPSSQATMGVSREEIASFFGDLAVPQPPSFVATPIGTHPAPPDDGEDIDVGESVPFGESVSGVDFGEDVPFAEAVSSGRLAPKGGPAPDGGDGDRSFLSGEVRPPAAAPEDSGVDFAAVDPHFPVLPASDWFHAADFRREGGPVAEDDRTILEPPAGGGPSDVYGRSPPRRVGTSDIFGSDRDAAKGHSDIFPHDLDSGRSRGTPPRGFDAGLPKPPSAVGLPSPPSYGAGAPDDDESLFADLADKADPARPPEPARPDGEAFDAGNAVPRSVDASSIMGELGGPPSLGLDGSDVELQNPGVGRTLSDDEGYSEADEPTHGPTEGADGEYLVELADEPEEPDVAPPAPRSSFLIGGSPAPAGSGGSTVPFPPDFGHPSDPTSGWHAAPGSDLFATARPPRRGDGSRHSDRVDPIDHGAKPDQPSLSSAPSSIFTGGKVPGSGLTGGSADVRIDRRDNEHTVFGDMDEGDDVSNPFAGPPSAGIKGEAAGRPTDPGDEDGVDWVTPAEPGDGVDWITPADPEGAIDFDLADPGEGERLDSPSGSIFAAADVLQGPPSGNIFSRTDLDGALSPSRAGLPTEDMAPEEDPYAYEAPLSGKGSAGVRGLKKPTGTGPGRTPLDDDSVVVNWESDSDEPKAVKAASGWDHEAPGFAAEARPESGPPTPPRRTEKAKARDGERPKAKRKGGGMLVGGLAGLLAGAGTCAGLYFGGVVPNGEESAAAQGGGDGAALALARKDLEAERGKAAEARMAVKGEQDRAAELKARADADLAKATAEKKEAEDKLAEAAATRKAAEEQLATARADALAAKAAADKFEKDAKDAVEAKAAAAKSDAAAKEALAAVEKSKADALAAAEKAAALEAAAKKAADDLATAAKEATAAKAALDVQEKAAAAATEQFKKADGERAKLNEAYAGIAKELQAGKFVGDNADPAAVSAAVKEAVSRASGPNVGNLIPQGASALAGTGLTAGQIVDLAERSNRSEAAARAAADRLTKETAALKADFTAQIDALKKGQADEAKRLADAQAVALKEARDGSAAAAKETAEKFAAEAARQKAEGEAAAKKLKDDYEGQVLAAQKRAAEDSSKAEASLAAMRADLANVMTPAQALDLWLPLLSDNRRPGDVAPALANADKVLKAAAPGTEAYAKAQAVRGVALLVRGDDAGAKEAFAAAKGDASYAADKPWGKAADEGALAVTDPVARFRKPVDPERKDPRTAARLLDEGVRLFAGRRYGEAEKALAQSLHHDTASPVAWYYLGAAKWQLGKPDAARDDFRQGAEREALRTVTAAAVESALAPIQGPVRAALTDARP